LNEVKISDLEKWWDECRRTITDESFIAYFNPSYYEKAFNEVPIQFKQADTTVYGVIDRLIIKDNNVTVIDYKTHPYVTKDNIKDVALLYEKQMQLYENATLRKRCTALMARV